MDRLDGSLGRELRRLGPPGDAAGMGDVLRAWPAAVGETVVRHAWPARLARDGTLHVTASSSTWAFELGRLAEDILGRLRATLGEGAPTGLRFAAGHIPEPAADAAALAPRTVSPSPEDVELGEALASGIGDEGLRALVARAAAASLARGRSAGPPDRGF